VEPDKKRARDINSRITPYLGFLVGNDSDLHDALGYETKSGAKRRMTSGSVRIRNRASGGKGFPN